MTGGVDMKCLGTFLCLVLVAHSAPASSTTSTSCHSGAVQSLGDCSSKFLQCRCDKWLTAVCPGSSTFDESTGTCLYSVSRCNTPVAPGTFQQNSYTAPVQEAPVGVSYPAALGPQPMWESEQLLSNPFFAHRRHRSHRKGGYRSNKVREHKGKLRTKSKPIRVDDRRSYVTDLFRGPYDPYIHSNSWSTFPRSRVHRMRMNTAMRTYPDDDETELLDPEVEVTENEDNAKASSSFIATDALEFEGSGDAPEEMNTRAKRSYGFSAPGEAPNDANLFCRGVATSTLVPLGFCRQDYVFCRSYVALVAACAVGDLYDDVKKSCVPSDACGVSGSEVCTEESSAPTAAALVQPVTTSAPPSPTEPVVPLPSDSTCTGVLYAIISSGCSNSYIICDNGVKHAMNCSNGLVFNKKTSNCDHRRNVVECGAANAEPPVAATVEKAVPYVVSATTPARPQPYVPTTASPRPQPYVPVIATAAPRDAAPAEEVKIPFVAPSQPAPVTDSAALNPAPERAVPYIASVTTPSTSAVPESIAPVHTDYANSPSPSGAYSFCTGRDDRLYRDPTDCTAIINCHGGEMFRHRGCSSGLVFNEETQSCDYRQNVRGCEGTPQNDTGCNGVGHGAFLPDNEDCSRFYRCVWNRLERMLCHPGTVFNPTLSVCDWPSAVPQCNHAANLSPPSHSGLIRPY